VPDPAAQLPHPQAHPPALRQIPAEAGGLPAGRALPEAQVPAGPGAAAAALGGGELRRALAGLGRGHRHPRGRRKRRLLELRRLRGEGTWLRRGSRGGVRWGSRRPAPLGSCPRRRAASTSATSPTSPTSASSRRAGTAAPWRTASSPSPRRTRGCW